VQAIDVKVAFLEGEIDHELCIDLPFQYEEYCADRGIELGKDVVLCLMMSQYGCVQSARIWSKKFVYIVTNEVCRLTQCKTDPCIFYRRDDEGKVVLLMLAYIDDAILAGKRYAIDDVKRGLREHLTTISHLGPLNRHLGVYYTKGEDDAGPYYETEMKDFVMDTVAIYEELVGKPATVFPSPGYPSTVLSKNEGAIMHQIEYSGVGGTLCNWQSKKQTGVFLSSTDAEFVSASELGRDIKFLGSLIDEVTGGQAIPPSHNTGAIFLMRNNGIGSRTKHVDIRMRFLNDMVENGELEVDHCPGKFITPDAITKNTPEAVHKQHVDTMYSGHILPPDYNRSNRQGGYQHCIGGA
jgi:hypothetical protein